jgi:hypothetical protein
VASSRSATTVPSAGQQHRQVGAVLGGVGERRVAKLVQRPPGPHAKQVGRPPVRQPGPPAGRIQVEAGDRVGRSAASEKHRPAGPGGQLAGEQLGRPGLPEHPLDRAALAANPRPPVRQVQIFDVQAEQFVGAGGGLI